MKAKLMKVGDLVKVMHPTVGVPFGALAIISRVMRSNFNEFNIYDLVVVGTKEQTRRQGRDLELVASANISS